MERKDVAIIAGRQPQQGRAPQRDPRTDQVVERAGEGQSRREIAEETGISERQVRHIAEEEATRLEAFERGREQGRTEAEIDINTLSQSARNRLESAIRQYQRRLEREFDARVRAQVTEIIETFALPGLQQRERDAQTIMNSHRGIFSVEQYNKLLRVVHPDMTPTIDQKNEAFQLLHENRLVLLSHLDNDRQYERLIALEELWRRVDARERSRRRDTETN
jgi:hypothetical protein